MSTAEPLSFFVVTRRATELADSALLRHLQRAGVRTSVWLAGHDALPADADAAQALVLLHDPVLQPADRERLLQLLRNFWHRRLTVACFDGSAHWLEAAGLVPADAPLEAEGVVTHEGAADLGALAELLDTASTAPHTLR